MLVQGLRYGPLPASETAWAWPGPGLFLAGVALLVIDLLSFGPFVSDYTRYLPAATSGRRLFWGIYAGSALATLLLLRGRRLPGRAAARPRPGRRHRQGLRVVGAGHHGRLA